VLHTVFYLKIRMQAVRINPLESPDYTLIPAAIFECPMTVRSTGDFTNQT
jgi:hypothetical protein